jgi:hypothetical protein
VTTRLFSEEQLSGPMLTILGYNETNNNKTEIKVVTKKLETV